MEKAKARIKQIHSWYVQGKLTYDDAKYLIEDALCSFGTENTIETVNTLISESEAVYYGI